MAMPPPEMCISCSCSCSVTQGTNGHVLIDWLIHPTPQEDELRWLYFFGSTCLALGVAVIIVEIVGPQLEVGSAFMHGVWASLV